MAKRRRGSTAQRQADTPAGAWHLVEKLADDLGIGIVVGKVVNGPPCRITAVLSLGLQQTQVSVEGLDEASALRELARTAASWRPSNEVSFYRSFWGG